MTHSQTQGAEGAGTKTAGESSPFGDVLPDPASEIATQVMNLTWTRHGLGSPGEGFDDDGLCDRHGDVQIIARNVIEATPAPAATPGVPDSVRALSEGDEAVFACACARWVRALLAAQPAGRTGDAGADGWLPIETAPRDGSRFDAWAVEPDAASRGVRFVDVQMRGDGSGFGVVIHRPDVHWEYLEQDGPTFPAWKLTHWRRPPACPGRPAHNSTRTGAAETELTERDIEAPIYEAFARYVGNADERASDFRMFATGYHAALAARPEAPSDAGIAVDVLTMRLCDGRADYFVRIKCGDRETTPYKFSARYKAEYEAAHFAWIFGLRPDEPDLMAYDEASHPNDPTPPSDPAPSGQAEG